MDTAPPAPAPVRSARPRWWWWELAVVASLPLLWLGRPGPPPLPDPDLPEAVLRPMPHDPAILARGKLLWSNCISCHGPSGEGAIGPNLRDDVWLHGSDMRDLVRDIANGNPMRGMPVWKEVGLGWDDIHALA